MNKKKVISAKSLPTRPPIIVTLTAIACLKAFNANQTIWAVVITLLVIIWLSSLIAILGTEEQVEPKL